MFFTKCSENCSGINCCCFKNWYLEKKQESCSKKLQNEGNLLPVIEKYYTKLIPLSYVHDPIGLLGVLKTIISFFLYIVGFFRPVPRGPIFRHDVFEIVTKAITLACQNFMMALVAQGYDSCPIEGFDKKESKRY